MAGGAMTVGDQRAQNGEAVGGAPRQVGVDELVKGVVGGLEAQQEAVGVVLHYQQVSLGGQLDQPPSALERKCRAGGVAEIRYGVEELRPAALGFKGIEHLGDGLHYQAIGVHRQMPDVRLVGGKGGERARVRGALRQNDVAGIDECLGDQVDALLGPGGYEHVRRIDDRPFLEQDLGDVLLHEVEPLGGAGLQGKGPVTRADVKVDLVEHLLREALGSRHTSRERYHLGASGEAHEVAYGRRAHDADAGCVAPLVFV